MNEKLICENNILDYNYKYYLVKAPCNTDGNLNQNFKYGVKIDKYSVVGKIVDSKCVPHIFDTEEKMIKAIRIINKLQVTPITLEDIVIDNVYSR